MLGFARPPSIADADDADGREARTALDGMAGQHHDQRSRRDGPAPISGTHRGLEPIVATLNWKRDRDCVYAPNEAELTHHRLAG